MPINEVAKSVSERIQNPLFASFLLSAFAWNWRFFFILFIGEGTATERLKYIDGTLYSEGWAFPWIWYPLLGMAVYCVLFYGGSIGYEFIREWASFKVRKTKVKNQIRLRRFDDSDKMVESLRLKVGGMILEFFESNKSRVVSEHKPKFRDDFNNLDNNLRNLFFKYRDDIISPPPEEKPPEG